MISCYLSGKLKKKAPITLAQKKNMLFFLMGSVKKCERVQSGDRVAVRVKNKPITL